MDNGQEGAKMDKDTTKNNLDHVPLYGKGETSHFGNTYINFSTHKSPSNLKLFYIKIPLSF